MLNKSNLNYLQFKKCFLKRKPNNELIGMETAERR